MNNILITGGAGYIGSHIVKALVDEHETRLTVIDNLSTGFADSIAPTIKFIQGDIQNTILVSKIIKAEKINTVIHLAASTVIPESIEHPLQYYQNNTVGTLHLLKSCVDNHVENFIYSSTAAVYGPTSQEKIKEDSPTNPTNPYGHSKLMSEQLIKDVATSSKLKFVILRYFNVAGASLDRAIGQRTKNATHLIKMAVQTACGQHPHLPIYGTNYPTLDGTCIRDFIHVCDLANAHIKAIQYLQKGGISDIFNCGYGHGYSVKEVVNAVEKLTQKSLPILPSLPRKGDLAQVIADNAKIKQNLNWQPQYDDLAIIVKTALDWEMKSTNQLSNA